MKVRSGFVSNSSSSSFVILGFEISEQLAEEKGWYNSKTDDETPPSGLMLYRQEFRWLLGYELNFGHSDDEMENKEYTANNLKQKMDDLETFGLGEVKLFTGSDYG